MRLAGLLKLAVFCLLPLVFSACSDDDDHYEIPQGIIEYSGEKSFSVAPDATALGKEIAFKTNSSWIASVKYSSENMTAMEPWVILDPAYAMKAGHYHLKIMLKANTTPIKRKAEISIRCEFEYLTLTIEQEGVRPVKPIQPVE